jgi:hypothetical protein
MLPVGFAPRMHPFAVHHPHLAFIGAALVFVLWARFMLAGTALFMLGLLSPIAAVCRLIPRFDYVYSTWKRIGQGLVLAWSVAVVWMFLLLR